MVRRLVLFAALLVGVTGLIIFTNASTATDIAEARADTVVVLVGEFQPRARSGSGQVAILQLPDGRMMARVTNVETATGADVRLYLLGATDARATNLERIGFIDLGPLRTGRGPAYYLIPANTPLARVQAIAVWERSGNLNYSTAELRRP